MPIVRHLVIKEKKEWKERVQREKDKEMRERVGERVAGKKNKRTEKILMGER